MNGILPLWKPKSLTSHDCVVKIRKLFKTKKVGHTGTLDPEVEGVLPICIGEATKIVPFLTDTKKTYVADISLGMSTDTEDSHGYPLEKMVVNQIPSDEEINLVLQGFEGCITQVPPMYSAVKVNGKKLYEYAREGIEVERPSRKVYIYGIQYLGSNPESKTFKIEVECSKGTYIRTLSVDIGRKLGFPAHMADLTRLRTGAFSKKNSVTFAMIEKAIDDQTQHTLLKPIICGIQHLDVMKVDKETKNKVKNGQKLPFEQSMKTDPFAVLFEEELLAIYQKHPEKPGQLKPVRVFQG
ncbi:tRNA pseudouridine(55) synthase TruB [Virgibacillus halodenitrificans]|uniref:tRNA pseudouridine(55) synthase TruB n=1 Tax=Virgibacillus halodenitrificans TaxID=1482 RepID=UPI0024BF9482|nr:tRNA pseudouridine(55) synthase TruB [Virgibacillus halodenitrificans]WHX27204.1 tRNA pseudouridine(55) synthase TruB [Virgibacillus halodenitrificans]